MANTVEDLDKLDRSIANPVQQVTEEDRSMRKYSIQEQLAARAAVLSNLQAQGAVPVRRKTLIATTSGFED